MKPEPVSKGFYLGTIIASWVLALLLFVGTGVAMGVSEHTDADEVKLVGLAFLAGGFGMVILAEVLSFVLIYKMWAAIQSDGRARTTPGAAVGLLFVPFYNLYWIFQVYQGWAQDYNAFIRRHRVNVPPVSEGTGTTVCILALLGMIPYLGALFTLASEILRLVYFSSAIDAINALANAEPVGRDDYEDDYGGRFGDRRGRGRERYEEDDRERDDYYGRGEVSGPR